jgi:UrcA family protein
MLKPAAMLLTALSAAIALPAAAKADGTPTTIRVSHADLDLTSADGQDVLRKRLDSAARRVCDVRYNNSIASLQRSLACYRQTRRDVQVQVQFAMETAGLPQRGG